jgi:hypothetical protein
MWLSTRTPLISSYSLSLFYSCTSLFGCTFSCTQTGEDEPPPKNFIDFEGVDGTTVRWYWHTVTDEEIKKDQQDKLAHFLEPDLEPWMLGKTYYYTKPTKDKAAEKIWYHPRVWAAEKEKAAAEKAAADAKVVILRDSEKLSVFPGLV